MSAAAKGPRLWLRKARRGKAGRITHAAVWLVLDGEHQESTGCGPDDRIGAEKQLEAYLNRKHTAQAKVSARDPYQIPIADVLNLYAEQVAPGHARPKETAQKIERLLAFFGTLAKGRRRSITLADINGDLCRSFAASRSTPTAAREDLIVLRSAINHHREEGYCHKLVSVVLPAKAVGREEWCTRSQVAKLIWTAWRYREIQDGKPTNRRPWRHVAKFLLVTAYTGTRSGASCAAALEPTEGRGWIDVESGIFYRRPQGARETKKRRPPVPIPYRLLAHLRRWKRLGQRYAVEWHGEPVNDCDKAFRNVARAAGLPWVTPHIMRHTCGTWLAQSGTPLWQSAGFLGMTVQQFEETYGHHHPDYMGEARAALDRPPMLRQRMPATERERTPSNVTKIADRLR
jgi:integrase